MQLRCGDCMYWVKRQVHEFGGHCHKYPPTIWENRHGSFPMTGQEDWCGEFRARKNSLNELLEENHGTDH
jgi:hypothetical protein